MPRLRTLKETYVHLKIMDSETAITPNALRRMVVTGQVPCVKVGKKYLIDLDTLESFLKGTKPAEALPDYTLPLGSFGMNIKCAAQDEWTYVPMFKRCLAPSENALNQTRK